MPKGLVDADEWRPPFLAERERAQDQANRREGDERVKPCIHKHVDGDVFKRPSYLEERIGKNRRRTLRRDKCVKVFFMSIAQDTGQFVYQRSKSNITT
jgi:hypothetical protein